MKVIVDGILIDPREELTELLFLSTILNMLSPITVIPLIKTT